MGVEVPNIIQDYGFSLTTPSGVVYTAEKYPWTERDFFLNMKWGYKAFTKAEDDLTRSDLEYLFDNQFYTSLFYGRTLAAESSHVAFTLYKVDGVNLGFTEVEYYVDENSTRHIKNISQVIAPSLRGQGHSKYINAMLNHVGRYFVSTYSEAAITLRHGSIGARKNVQNAISRISLVQGTPEYNPKAEEYIQKIEYPTQGNMTAQYEKITELGTYSTTNPDEYWKESPKTDAKWAHPQNITTPNFAV